MPSPRRCSGPEMDTSWATAAEIAAAVTSGKVSAVQVTQDALARIGERDPVLNAFTDVLAERALARAATPRIEAAASPWQSAQALLASPALRRHSASPSSTESVAGFDVSSSCIALVAGLICS